MKTHAEQQCECGVPIGWYRKRCEDCQRRHHFSNRYLSGMALAHTTVARARKQGVLAHPRTLPCADCGGIATEYDHRDYSFPLAVVAVCRRCNHVRGKGIPKRWQSGEWRAYVQRVEKQHRQRPAYAVDLFNQFREQVCAVGIHA